MSIVRWKINQIHVGLDLRTKGLSYNAIAVVLNEYHDMPRLSAGAVRSQLRTHGAIASPRGGQGNLRRGSIR